MIHKLFKIYHFIDKFKENELTKLNKNIIVIFRNYKNKINKENLVKIRDFLKKKGNKFYLSNDVKMAHKLKKDKLFCITDAVTETNKGPYKHKNSGYFYSNNGELSGSCITMPKSFKNLIEKVGLSVQESIDMCSNIPLKVIKGVTSDIKLKKGNFARFNILDFKYNLVKSIC